MLVMRYYLYIYLGSREWSFILGFNNKVYINAFFYLKEGLILFSR